MICPHCRSVERYGHHKYGIKQFSKQFEFYEKIYQDFTGSGTPESSTTGRVAGLFEKPNIFVVPSNSIRAQKNRFSPFFRFIFSLHEHVQNFTMVGVGYLDTTGLAVGLKKGFLVEKRKLAARPASRKGVGALIICNPKVVFRSKIPRSFSVVSDLISLCVLSETWQACEVCA